MVGTDGTLEMTMLALMRTGHRATRRGGKMEALDRDITMTHGGKKMVSTRVNRSRGT